MTTYVSDIAWEARELLDGLDHYRDWVYEDMARVLDGPDTDHTPLHTVTLSGDYMIGGWMEEGHARFAAAAPRIVRELLAENERLHDDLDAAAYRAGQQQGRYADTLRALDRVQTLADEMRTSIYSTTTPELVAALIDRALDGEGQP